MPNKTKTSLFIASVAAAGLIFVISIQATDRVPVIGLSAPANIGQAALSAIVPVAAAVSPGPVLLNTTSVISNGAPSNPYDIKVAGDYAFVPGMVPAGKDAYGVFKVYNISDTAKPTEAASVKLGGFPFAIDIAGLYAYVTNRQTNVIHVFDISNPNKPVEKSSVATDAVPYDIQASGNYLYVVNLGGHTLQVFDIADPLNPARIASVKFMGYSPTARERAPNGFHVVGNYLYAVSRGITGTAGILHIFDISDSRNPIEKSAIKTIIDPFNVFVSGSYAYVDGGQVFDVSDPGNPKELGKMACQIKSVEGGVGGGRFSNVRVENGLVYVSVSAGQARHGALCVFNMCDFKTWPKVCFASVVTDYEPYFFDISGDHLYLTNSYGDKSLQVFDISGCKAVGAAECPVEELGPEPTAGIQPSAPPTSLNAALVGSVNTGADPQGIAISGKYAYAVNVSSKSLQVFDLSDIFNPVLVGSIATSGDPRGVAVCDGYICVTNWVTNAFQLFDISDPAHPRLAGSATTNTGPWDVEFSGHYAYVANYGSNTLQVFDISNQANPRSVATVSTVSSGPFDIEISGPYLYLTSLGLDDPEKPAPSVLQVFDISNPANPVSVAATNTGKSPRSIAISGCAAYVANYNSDTLQVFNVCDPKNPFEAGSVKTDHGPRSIEVVDSHAYLVNSGSNTLQIFDILDPSKPVLTDTFSTDQNPRGVRAMGLYAVVVNTDSDTLQVFDVFGVAPPRPAPTAPAAPAAPTTPPFIEQLTPTIPEIPAPSVAEEVIPPVVSPIPSAVPPIIQQLTPMLPEIPSVLAPTPLIAPPAEVPTAPAAEVLPPEEVSPSAAEVPAPEITPAGPSALTSTGSVLIPQPIISEIPTVPPALTSQEQAAIDQAVQAAQQAAEAAAQAAEDAARTAEQAGQIGQAAEDAARQAEQSASPDMLAGDLLTPPAFEESPAASAASEAARASAVAAQEAAELAEQNAHEATDAADVSQEQADQASQADSVSAAEAAAQAAQNARTDAEESAKLADQSASLAEASADQARQAADETAAIVSMIPAPPISSMLTPEGVLGPVLTPVPAPTPAPVSVAEEITPPIVLPTPEPILATNPLSDEGLSAGQLSKLKEGRRMTGGGTIGDTDATHGFTLHCDAAEEPNNLEINWRVKGAKGIKTEHKFRLEILTSAFCGDSPTIDQLPRAADFDTLVGSGSGRYDGEAGATIEFTFVDAGEPGRFDSAKIVIKDAAGKEALNVFGTLKNGNHQAHQ